MISDPGMIHYTCIAKGTTILAEFNSIGAALRATAAKCLEKTPPFHAMFTHTVRSKTYTFLIDEPFVYFLISDEKLVKAEGLALLKSLRDAFFRDFKSERKLEKLSPYCFQGECNPVFRQLLGPAAYIVGEIGSLASGLLGEKGLSVMKNRLVEQVNVEKEVDENEKGKKVWKKQAWAALWLDLVVCSILFLVWLWVCSGLKCMEG